MKIYTAKYQEAVALFFVGCIKTRVEESFVILKENISYNNSIIHIKKRRKKVAAGVKS